MRSANKRAIVSQWEDSAISRALSRYRRAAGARPLQHLGAAMLVASAVELALGLPAGRPWWGAVVTLLLGALCLRSRERWADLRQRSLVLRWWDRTRGEAR